MYHELPPKQVRLACGHIVTTRFKLKKVLFTAGGYNPAKFKILKAFL